MLEAKPIEFNDLRGTIYDFPLVGDILPMHWHTSENVHITVVCRGSFKATGPNWEKIISAGDVINWEPLQQHEFASLEPNSRLVNIVKGSGVPANEYGTPPQ